jgi:hypothetical protein
VGVTAQDVLPTSLAHRFMDGFWDSWMVGRVFAWLPLFSCNSIVRSEAEINCKSEMFF